MTNDFSRWQTGLGPAELSAVQELLASATVVDGVAPLSGHILSALGSVGDSYLLAEVDGDLAGVAVSHEGDPTELVVAPPFRRQGVGSGLVTAATARVGSVWAHGDLGPARALADKLGLVRTRLLLQMRRIGRPSVEPAAVLPAGVRIRTFVPGQDEAAFLGVNARAFSWHPEQGRLDLAGLQDEMAQDWFDPAGFFLAVSEDDTVLGFHWTKVHATDATPGDAEPGPVGEIYVLGVDPQSSARGLGGPLTAAGLDHLADRGLTTVMLYVEGDNDRALKLYRRYGFQVHLTDAVYSLPTAAE